MNRESKCPFHHSWEPLISPSEKIMRIVTQLKNWVVLPIDSAEQEQALFAYRIYQLWCNLDRIKWIINWYLDELNSKEGTYAAWAEQIKKHFLWICIRIFTEIEPNQKIVARLKDWINTFHAFTKRAVILSSNTNVGFPYQQAVQFASSSIERLNILAFDPYVWWEGLFFDPEIDVRTLLQWIPISRPIYKCPVLYSWEFRRLSDYYFELLKSIWENSSDKPKNLWYF